MKKRRSIDSDDEITYEKKHLAPCDNRSEGVFSNTY